MDGAALLKRIYDSPEDDGARAVYADWLEERGDPRGPFIALQLAKRSRELTEQERRDEYALLAEHGARWLEPLTPLLSAPVFERGFLAECTLATLEPGAMVQAWATVERLHWTGPDGADVARFVLNRVMRSLLSVSGLGPRTLAAMADAGRGVPALELYGELDGATIARLHQLSGLTALSLPTGLRQPRDLVALLGSKVAGQLTRVDARRAGLDLFFSTPVPGAPFSLVVRSARPVAELVELLRACPRLATLTVAMPAERISPAVQEQLAQRAAQVVVV